jgi:hypothetical protein
VIVVYAATATGGTLCVDDESLEVLEWDIAAIPWNDLAFSEHPRGPARLLERLASPHPGLKSFLSPAAFPTGRLLYLAA